MKRRGGGVPAAIGKAAFGVIAPIILKKLYNKIFSLILQEKNGYPEITQYEFSSHFFLEEKTNKI